MQVGLLAAAQALFQTASVLVMTIGGLAGAQAASTPELATAPIAAMFAGTMAVTVPASEFMARYGRRRGFVTGAILGAAGGLIAAYGVYLVSLSVICAGTFLIGAHQAFAQFYRFAASEVSDDQFRPRAISLVLAGGVIAAFLGPWLGRFGVSLLPQAYAGSFALVIVLAVIAAAVLSGLRISVVQDVHTNVPPPRRLLAIVTQPIYAVALFGAATGYGVMILAMTATPLAMTHHDHGLDATATVIQLHVLGMFAPSFVTGSLIARFGVLQIMLAGVALFAGFICLSLTGTNLASFATALVLLGVGWNFLYIGGTALLTQAYAPHEKARAQAANDLSIFVVGLAASLGAGVLHQALGWHAMNVLLLPWLAVAAAAIVWLGRAQRMVRAAQR